MLESVRHDSLGPKEYDDDAWREEDDDIVACGSASGDGQSESGMESRDGKRSGENGGRKGRVSGAA